MVSNIAPTLVLIFVPRLAIYLVTGVYCCKHISLLQSNLIGPFTGLNIYRIWTNRRETKSILSSSTGNPADNRYNRLFMLSGMDIAIAIPFNIWYFTTNFPLLPWLGWKAVHRHWSQVFIMNPAVSRTDPRMFYQAEIPRWTCVVYGFLFFFFFGVTAEARRQYASVWKYVSKLFCWQAKFSRESSGYVLGFYLI
jgi:Pheromone A receptor